MFSFLLRKLYKYNNIENINFICFLFMLKELNNFLTNKINDFFIVGIVFSSR